MKGWHTRFRRAARFGRWLLLVLVLAWLGARLWALRVVRTAVPEFEARHGSIDPMNWARKPDDPGVRAGRLLRAAALILDRSEPDFSRWRRAEFEASQRGFGEPVELAALEAAIERQARSLDLVREAGRGESCVLLEKLPLLHDPPIDGPAFAELARLELQNALRELAAQNDTMAQERLNGAFALSDCLQGSRLQLLTLSGLEIERRNLWFLHWAVEGGDGRIAGPRLLSRLGSRSPAISFAESIRVEAAMLNQELHGAPKLGRPPRASGAAPGFNPFQVDGFMEAMGLRGLARSLAGLDAPERPASNPGGSFAPWNADKYYDAAFARHFWNSARVVEAQSAARRLALLAATLAAASSKGAGEEELARICLDHTQATTAFAGEAIQIEARPDGSRLVSLPKSALRWAQLHAHEHVQTKHLPWHWTVPAAAAR